jgi:hypothetical protein
MAGIIQVYTESTTPRLIYSLDLIFKNILNLDYKITSNPNIEDPLINYSNNRNIGGIFIQPEGLLSESGVRKQDIWIAHLDALPLFFQQAPEAGFNIDIFSFAFYLVSRYEEYLPFTRDEHGRFAAESSLAYKHNFINKPVVDIWAQRFGKTISILYPKLKIKRSRFSSLLTLDIDQPYEYRGEGLYRNLFGLINDLIRGRKASERIGCMAGRQKDPYDTYDYINDTCTRFKSPVKYFFTAGKKSKYDKNPSPLKPCYRRLIKSIGMKYEIGLHPSYLSNKDKKILLWEKSRLEQASGKEISDARKHFLLLDFPQTYQQLIDIGIQTDFTLGFIREAGFRAGIARPFKFYDLLREEATNLTLVPFQYTDGTYQQRKRFTPDEAKKAIKVLIDETRAVGGLFVSVWHNTSLVESGEWLGWRDVFEFTLKEQSKK